MSTALPPSMLDKIVTGDNVRLMRRCIPDNSIDLTVTSPPYDNLRDYDGYSWDFPAVAGELYRVTRPGGVVVWVVGDATVNGSETGSSFRQALCFMGLGFNCETMIYDTGQQGAKGSHDFYWQQFEFMFVFTKGRPSTVNRIRDHKNKYAGTKNTSTRRQKDGSRADERFVTPEMSVRGNVWYYPTGYGVSSPDKITFEHPAPFPESLARDHIISWSNPGDIVFDPFVGSGTTCKMAHLLDRRFIGIEVSERYAAIARERVRRVQIQPKLIPFAAVPQVVQP